MKNLLLLAIGLASALGLHASCTATGVQDHELSATGTHTEAEIRARLAEPGAHEPYLPAVPWGLPSDYAERIPADNPLTPAKVELGHQLFFDPRLSADGSVSCATCHNPFHGWADGRRISTGFEGRLGRRSAPPLTNIVFENELFWDGRSTSLEEQVVEPLTGEDEMASSMDAAVATVNSIPGYLIQFEAIFGEPATPETLAKAIAAYERTILYGGTPFDVYQQSLPPEERFAPEASYDPAAAPAPGTVPSLSEEALLGFEVFTGEANCTECHTGPTFSDGGYHGVGAGVHTVPLDRGRAEVTGDSDHVGFFRTPRLRGLRDSAPYMHNGQYENLTRVVKHYKKGGYPYFNIQSEEVVPLRLSFTEMCALEAFLTEGLASAPTYQAPPRLP